MGGGGDLEAGTCKQKKYNSDDATYCCQRETEKRRGREMKREREKSESGCGCESDERGDIFRG